MSVATLSPLAVVLAVVAYWIILGMVVVWLGRERDAVRALYPAGAVGALLLAWCGWLCLGAPPQTLGLPLGLPDLPFHLRADALSGFFLLLLGLAAAGVLAYSTGYLRGGADS